MIKNWLDCRTCRQGWHCNKCVCCMPVENLKRRIQMAKGSGIMKELKCSDELRAIVKDKKMSRGQVIKNLWKYIKKNDLQSSKDKRIVKCDDKLKALFKNIIKKERKLVVRGKKMIIPAGRIFMTEMGGGLSKHLTA